MKRFSLKLKKKQIIGQLQIKAEQFTLSDQPMTRAV